LPETQSTDTDASSGNSKQLHRHEVRLAAPTSEFSFDFVQGMANRMAVSFFKYGKVEDAYPHRVDALMSLQQRIDRYMATGNTEYLIDAANFAMIEFMHPSHPKAHFSATDSDGSTGRMTVEGDVSFDPNKEL